jgi:hypothetical protein
MIPGSAASAKLEMPDKKQIVASSVGNISALLGDAIIVMVVLFIGCEKEKSASNN